LSSNWHLSRIGAVSYAALAGAPGAVHGGKELWPANLLPMREA
jgi:hypothetical protein